MKRYARVWESYLIWIPRLILGRIRQCSKFLGAQRKHENSTKMLPWAKLGISHISKYGLLLVFLGLRIWLSSIGADYSDQKFHKQSIGRGFLITRKSYGAKGRNYAKHIIILGKKDHN